MQHRLYELRRARNITQQRLAIDLGVDQASISSYECGKHLPTIEILLKLAEYFGVSIDNLFYINGEENILEENYQMGNRKSKSRFNAIAKTGRIF